MAKRKKNTEIVKHEPIQVELADWMFRQQAPVKIKEIAVALKEIKIRRHHPDCRKAIYPPEVQRYITLTRETLETKKQATIIFTRDRLRPGYQIALAGSAEIAEFAVRQVKRVTMMADRVNRLHPMVDPKHVPAAVERVYQRASNRITNLSGLTKQFVSSWRNQLTHQTTEGENGNGKNQTAIQKH